MFRDRSGQLCHLIERYISCDPTNDSEPDSNPSCMDEKILRRAKIESFTTKMIQNMVEDKVLDLDFITLSYEFDQEFFIEVFKKAISMFYTQSGCVEFLEMISQVKYFQQVIEGFKSVYEQIKDSLPSNTTDAFHLLNKLNKLKAIEEFNSLPDEQISVVNDMTENLEPFAIAPEPVRPTSNANWVEHNLLYNLIENSYKEERDQFHALFRREE